MDGTQIHAGVAVGHADVLTAVGEGEGAVAVVDNGPDLGFAEAGQGITLNGNVDTDVVVAGLGGGESLHVAGGVDDHLVAVLDGAGGLLRLFGFFGFGSLAGILNDQVDLLGEEGLIVDAVIAAPGAVVGLILQSGIPGGILDVEAVGGGGYIDLPAGIHIVQGSAGVAGAHGELLALRGGEGVGAVLTDAQGPDFSVGITGQDAVGDGDIDALVIVAAVGGGQSLQVGGVEDNHGVAVLKGGQVGDDAALTGGLSGFFQLVERKVGGIAVGVAGDGGSLVAPELVLGALVACQDYGVGTLACKGKGAVGASDRPVVITGLDAVVIAALGGNGNAIAVGQLDIGAVHSDRPDQIRCGSGDHAIGGGNRFGKNPGAVQYSGGIAGIHRHDILAGGQFVHRGDLFVGSRAFSNCGDREHGNDHDQHQHRGKQPA